MEGSTPRHLTDVSAAPQAYEKVYFYSNSHIGGGIFGMLLDQLS